MVEVSLTVGKLEASLALLLTKEHYLIEYPTILLPKDVKAGSIVKIVCERDEALEQKDRQEFMAIQDMILDTFGKQAPKRPELRVRNVTETSAVLEWDKIDVATADVISLTLYKNGSRFGIIPNPLSRTAIKLSSLAIDTAYVMELVLETTAGTYRSDKVQVKTHKMTDLTGITLCLGTIEDTDIDREDLEQTVKNIGAKPLQDIVRLDTTHFVCTKGEGEQWQRALKMNIPVVRPEWIKACEAERRLVSVRAYYLDADPKLRPPVQRSRATSTVTQGSFESTGHKRAVSEITDMPAKHAQQPSVPEAVQEVDEPASEQPVSNESTEAPSAEENSVSEEATKDTDIKENASTSEDIAAEEDTNESSEPSTTQEKPETAETSVEETPVTTVAELPASQDIIPENKEEGASVDEVPTSTSSSSAQEDISEKKTEVLEPKQDNETGDIGDESELTTPSLPVAESKTVEDQAVKPITEIEEIPEGDIATLTEADVDADVEAGIETGAEVEAKVETKANSEESLKTEKQDKKEEKRQGSDELEDVSL